MKRVAAPAPAVGVTAFWPAAASGSAKEPEAGAGSRYGRAGEGGGSVRRNKEFS